MAFVISKNSTERGIPTKLYYLVSNYREGKKVKRRTLLKLNSCKTPQELLNRMNGEKAALTARLNRFENDLSEFLKSYKIPRIMSFVPAHKVKSRLIMSVDQVKNDLKKCEEDITMISSFCSAGKSE